MKAFEYNGRPEKNCEDGNGQESNPILCSCYFREQYGICAHSEFICKCQHHVATRESTEYAKFLALDEKIIKEVGIS